jgi:hypothetical protein
LRRFAAHHPLDVATERPRLAAGRWRNRAIAPYALNFVNADFIHEFEIACQNAGGGLLIVFSIARAEFARKIKDGSL